ncbi:MAG TPA: molybdopterin oxidoreductase, partial [Roseiflexaceae bacterium]|nr:molybdopterin oxidoreductase [Roseiflexaceae bacterium]
MLVTSYDGRPVKIEGNPQHPINKGSTTLAMQAAILDMYDQDRSRTPIHAGKESTWAEFSAWAKTHFDGLAGTQGNGLAFLTEANSSPSVQALKQRIVARFPNATWHEYEAINNDNAVQGSMLAFGAGAGHYRPLYDFAAAKTIVALDADFLGAGTPASLKWTRDYAAGRKCDEGAQPSRMYAIEGVLSLTGANADHRVSVRSSDVAKIASWIASQVGVSGIPSTLATLDVATLGDKAALQDAMTHLVEDLKHGPSIVIVGERQPAEVHLLGHLINRALGNVGRTINYSRVEGLGSGDGHVASIKSLTDKINAGSVSTLVLLGGNPVYNAPSDLDFAAALKKVANSVHL